jgi:hypothetical protein
VDISVAIPYHGDRLLWTLQTVQNLHTVPSVKEFVLCLEPDVPNFRAVAQSLGKIKKVKIFQNPIRLHALHNKIRTVSACQCEWVALLDSDNIFNPRYVNSFIAAEGKSPSVIFCPERAEPIFRFNQYGGMDIGFDAATKMLESGNLNSLMNLGNYVFNRERWLGAMRESSASDYMSHGADAIWINFCCLRAGMVLRIVKGMSYKHTFHSGSTSIEHGTSCKAEADKIYEMMRGFVDPPKVLEEKRMVDNWSSTVRNARDNSKLKPKETELLTD